VTRPACAALGVVLADLARVVDQLTRSDYAESGLPGVSGSVGRHVRHCLDHVHAFERGIESGLADYECRTRDAAIEYDPASAVAALNAAAGRVSACQDPVLERAVMVRSQIDPGRRALASESTIGRELAFVISHSIHHSAAIALLVNRSGGCRLPERFGLAPGTPQPGEAA
jgi:uncharacterized damage-inducible protein DinB